MKKMKGLIAAAALSTLASLAYANGPVTVINNTHHEISFSSSFCGSDSKMCTLLNHKSLDKKGSNANSITLTAPLGKDKLTLHDISTVSRGKSPVISTRITPCEIPSNASVVILDDFGTSFIYCHLAF